jgi:hypothetical protein
MRHGKRFRSLDGRSVAALTTRYNPTVAWATPAAGPSIESVRADGASDYGCGGCSNRATEIEPRGSPLSRTSGPLSAMNASRWSVRLEEFHLGNRAARLRAAAAVILGNANLSE